MRETLEYSLGLGFPRNLHALSVSSWYKDLSVGIETGNTHLFIHMWPPLSGFLLEVLRIVEKEAHDIKIMLKILRG